MDAGEVKVGYRRKPEVYRVNPLDLKIAMRQELPVSGQQLPSDLNQNAQ
ncbi:MAG: hypothetical protein H0U88_08950 [Chthoniobacterales bacterium]|nr:hypothetical protein [Chthoniobacterales bacterium]